MNYQKGFTLIEIAIVLVIIGLLLSGVLKGQEMIDNSKIKNLRNDFEGVAAALYAYQDRYRCLPGDDLDIRTKARWNGQAGGNCDGNLGNNASPFTGADTTERVRFWQHLRYSGLLKGDGAATALPAHAFGANLGVVSGSGGTPLGLAGGVVMCADLVPGKAAEALDVQMDDGMPNTGNLRAATVTQAAQTVGNAGAAAYAESSAYVVCKAL